MRTICLVLLVAIPAVAHDDNSGSIFLPHVHEMDSTSVQAPVLPQIQAEPLSFHQGYTGAHWVLSEPDPIPDDAYQHSVEYQRGFIESFQHRTQQIKRENRIFAGVPGAIFALVLILGN